VSTTTRSRLERRTSFEVERPPGPTVPAAAALDTITRRLSERAEAKVP
jgi:hypothetical protein